jgi:hypothetical protein
MKQFTFLFFLLTCISAHELHSWNYTVQNNTPYYLLVAFNRIGLTENPVVLSPHTSTAVDSWDSIIEYCYDGAHLLIQPLVGQQTPQVDAGLSQGSLTPSTFTALIATMKGDAQQAAGGFVGGSNWNLIVGAPNAHIGGITSSSSSAVTYQAPYVSFPGDACWNKTLAINYDAASNTVSTSVAEGTIAAPSSSQLSTLESLAKIGLNGAVTGISSVLQDLSD